MASADVVTETEPVPSTLEDEGRGDGGAATDPKEGKKSRKFKPLEAMRKLFKTGRKRTKSKDDSQINVVAIKAKSTTALMSAGSLDDDEDSDGGFKSHQSKQNPLQGGKRSISEDSVFNPGDRTDGASLSALKTVAVSEENIHKNAFQNELFSKLKQRNSQYSDDDDGLPQSPVPPVTTADVLMGGNLKPHPTKSSSRESEKSLISVDGSDNEGDDPYLSNWSNPGKPRRSSDQSPPPTKGMSMDFDTVKSTQALDNTAALHKRSVKPQRRGNRQSRKVRENVSPHRGLPSLNEESPSKVLAEDSVFSSTKPDLPADNSVLTVSTKPGSGDKPKVSLTTGSKPIDTSVKPSTSVKTVETSKPSVAGKAPVHPPPVKTEPALSVVSVPKSGTDSAVTRGRSSSVKDKFEAEPPSSELSQAFSKLKRRSVKVDPEDVPPELDKPSEDKKSEVISFPVKKEEKLFENKNTPLLTSDVGASQSLESKPRQSVHQAAEDVKPKTEDTKSFMKHVEENKKVEKTVPETKTAVNIVEKAVDKSVSKSVIVTGGESKQTVSKQDDSKVDASPAKSVSYRTDESITPSSRGEEYKQKRASRSKTLPEQPVLPEELSAKVQRTKSQRADSSQSGAPVATASPKRQPNVNSTPMTKKIEPKRMSLHEISPSSEEPEWMAAIKKKKAENVEGKDSRSHVSEPKKEVLATEGKNVVFKDNVKQSSSTDRMTKSFTSSNMASPSKVEVKKTESFSTSTSRPTPTTSAKADSDTARFGSVKSVNVNPATSASVKPFTSVQGIGNKSVTSGQSTSTATKTVSSASTAKPVSMVTSTTSTSKQMSTTSSVSSTTMAGSSATPASTSRPVNISYTTTSSKSTPTATSSTTDSIKPFGSSVRETSKDTPSKVSPTEEAKIVFSRGQSVKTSTSSTVITSPSRSSSVKSSSSVKPSSSNVSKGSVQSSDSSSDKKESVPAWRSSIAKPPGKIQIEIIEKEPPKQDVVLRKKNPPPSSSNEADTCRDSSANRSSKVLDMVKNFQKLQVS